MGRIALITATLVALGASGAVAQSSGSGSVRVQPGQVCADNKCVRFSRDLRKVQIQGRLPVSVERFGLPGKTVVSLDTFRQIFHLALVQSDIYSDRG